MTVPAITETGNSLGINYYRPGEVLLLLEPLTGTPQDYPVLTEVNLTPLREVLSEVGIFLNFRPFQQPIGAQRPLVSLPRHINRERRVFKDVTRNPHLVIQAVNLRNWIPEPDKTASDRELATPVLEVAVAVKHINNKLARGTFPGDLGNYRLIAVSPNWLAVPF
jgi:hypothetical protein